MEAGSRAEALAHDLVLPLLIGGTVSLQRPFGAKLALAIGPEREVIDNETRARIDEARIRVARTLVPVDVLPGLGPAEWALSAALNDLLQATNHELSGLGTKRRHDELLDAVCEVAARTPLVHTLGEAVARHATFSRTLDVTRIDTTVSWWTGSKSFRGQSASARLTAWPGLRRVYTARQSVPLVDMAVGVPIHPERFTHALRVWLACSPLSDLATAARLEPRFWWSPQTLCVISTVAGENLALRAFGHATALDDKLVASAVTAMRESAGGLPAGSREQASALHFSTQLAAADAYWNREESA